MNRTAKASELIAAISGMVGAFLLASAVHPGLGFGAFLVSNIGWLTFAAHFRYWGMFLMQCVFLVSRLLGLWNWWLAPLVMG